MANILSTVITVLCFPYFLMKYLRKYFSSRKVQSPKIPEKWWNNDKNITKKNITNIRQFNIRFSPEVKSLINKVLIDFNFQ